MMLSDNAKCAASLVFDSEGRLEIGWVLKAPPFSEMSPNDIAKINAGLRELEAFGLISRRKNPEGSAMKEDIRLKDLSVCSSWPDILDVQIPVQ